MGGRAKSRSYYEWVVSDLLNIVCVSMPILKYVHIVIKTRNDKSLSVNIRKFVNCVTNIVSEWLSTVCTTLAGGTVVHMGGSGKIQWAGEDYNNLLH